MIKRKKGVKDGDVYDDAGNLQESNESAAFKFFNVQEGGDNSHLNKVSLDGLDGVVLKDAEFINSVIKTLDKKGSTLVKLNPQRVAYAKKQLRVLRTKFKESEQKVASELKTKAKKWLKEHILEQLGEEDEYF